MREDIRAMILETYNDLYQNKAVDEITLREIKAMCLPETKSYTASAIKKIRRKFKLSQAALARFLNVSLSTVQKWEIGDKNPSGSALKLLHVLEDHGIEVLV